MNPIRRKLLLTCISDKKGDFIIIQPESNLITVNPQNTHVEPHNYQLIELGEEFTVEIKLYNIHYSDVVNLFIYDKFVNTFNVSGNIVLDEHFILNEDSFIETSNNDYELLFEDYTLGGQFFIINNAEIPAHLVPLTFEHNNVKKSVDVVTNKSGTFNMGVATAEVIIEQSV